MFPQHAGLLGTDIYEVQMTKKREVTKEIVKVGQTEYASEAEVKYTTVMHA